MEYQTEDYGEVLLPRWTEKYQIVHFTLLSWTACKAIDQVLVDAGACLLHRPIFLQSNRTIA